MIYIIGSLRNPKVLEVGNRLRQEGFEVFEDWFAAGPEADDYWQRYEQAKGHTFLEALNGHAAWHVFNYDNFHLKRADAVVMLMPAGKSGHIELGVSIGREKPTYVLFDKEPERWDVMYRFATECFLDVEELVKRLKEPAADEDIWTKCIRASLRAA